jgi:hypothetical protein
MSTIANYLNKGSRIEIGSVVFIKTRRDFGFFIYHGLGIRFDKNENSFILEHKVIPVEELFFSGILVEYILLELSEIEIEIV